MLVWFHQGKEPLGRPRRRWEDNIKIDLQEVGGSCGDWMELAQDRDRWWAFVGTVRNLRVPKMRGISWLAAEPVSFSRRTLLHGVSKYDSTSASYSLQSYSFQKDKRGKGREKCCFYVPTACNFRLTCRQQVSPKRYCLSTEVCVIALSVTYLTVAQVESSVSDLTPSGYGSRRVLSRR